MKKLFTIMMVVIINLNVTAQSPEKMSYQSVIRNSNDQLVTSHQVGIQISILQGSINGTAVYIESLTPTTNTNGLVSIEIGTGNTSDDFATIDWENGPYFIKTEIDLTGGTSYNISGASQVLSVPYAFHAKTAETVTGPSMEILENKISAMEDLLIILGVFSVSDIDGNAYQIVKIGTQIWMAENLKTTKFNDGTDIPLVIDNSEWAELTTPGYSWYNNDEAIYGNTYGALYNWYTVGTGNLCPSGWHVPSDTEWKELEMALGMSKVDADITGFRGTNQGSKLASNEALWRDGALENDSEFGCSGFSALPGGYRFDYGAFASIEVSGYWMSSTEKSTNSAWPREIYSSNTDISRGYGFKQFGASVRCVRD